ncbi:hypothetical protein ACFOG5_12980 [Pedobacter fastidiosus]
MAGADLYQKAGPLLTISSTSAFQNRAIVIKYYWQNALCFNLSG